MAMSPNHSQNVKCDWKILEGDEKPQSIKIRQCIYYMKYSMCNRILCSCCSYVKSGKFPSVKLEVNELLPGPLLGSVKTVLLFFGTITLNDIFKKSFNNWR